MAQLQSPETYVDGQQVTATRLNNQTNGATLLPGAITDQTNITANTVASGDSLLLYDLSATALREATVSDILGSSLPIVASTVAATTVTTSAINAVANSDVLVTPNDGANVTGKTFVSADGITATVSSTAHGLVTGQNVTITASNAAYSGTYKITVTTVDAFTYVLFPTSTAASGTCSYVKEGSLRVAGELNASGGLNVTGNATLDSALRVGGTVNVAGNGTFSGTGALRVPVGTTLERPASPVIGQVRFNTTTVVLELYTGSAWVDAPNTAYIDAKPFAKAYVKFAGASGTVAKQNNVSSVTRNSTGNYTINFTTPLADADYVIVGSIVYQGTSSETTTFEVLSQSVSSFTVWTRGHGGTGQAAVRDCPSVYIAVFGT